MRRSFSILILLTIFFSACNSGGLPTATPSQVLTRPEQPGIPESTSLPSGPETEITFRVAIPANTPENTLVYISILDEVTGLALNVRHFRMEPEPDQPGAPRRFRLTLPFAIGSLVLYRYERQSEAILVNEHTSDGSPVRYRLYSVVAPGTLTDVVSRWTDTVFEGDQGRIIGQALDASSGQPLPQLLVTAGGAQTFTASDGSFRIEGLPIGIHNLVAIALDGSYQTFQQGAQVAAESTTPTPLKLNSVPQVRVTFVVKVPDDTPPIVPLRLAGNLVQLGNTFATLHGGISSLISAMPVLETLPDGRYTVTLSLPVGADVRYKYTLGDGFWNAEYTTTGEIRLRQLIVPTQNTLIQESVDTWHTIGSTSISFDLTVPATTPLGDEIYLQLNPLFGWTEPIPMWRLSENRWGYVLYSPLNLPGNLNYRYCRNSLCGRADDSQTPGEFGKGRIADLSNLPFTHKDQVTAWVDLEQSLENFSTPTDLVNQRGSEFMAGISLEPGYQPIMQYRMLTVIEQVKRLGANWLVLTPGWSYTHENPPLLEPIAGSNPLWDELLSMVEANRIGNIHVALYPTPEFNFTSSCPDTGCLDISQEWWQNAQRDFSWWIVWFEQYRKFAVHFADLAQQAGADELILGGDWLLPALPGGKLADQTPSNVPGDSETRWRNLITEVRSHFTGTLAWAVSTQAIASPPPFIEAFDQIYLTWEGSQRFENATPKDDLAKEMGLFLDDIVRPVHYLADKPIVLAVSLPSKPDVKKQWDDYHTILQLVNERPWFNGLVSQGYFPWAALQDETASVNAKPASALLAYWFPKLLEQNTP